MRIVVVGGGVVALASAYRLAKAGCEVVVLEARTAGSAATHGNAAKIALAESGPVPAPGVILQGLRWMLKPDSPLYVKPSMAPDFIKFMLTMARHCNARDFRFGLETHLRLASDANDLLDEYTKDGIEFEMHKAGVLLAFETRERYEEHCGSLPIFEGFGMHPTHLDSDGVQETEPALNERIKHGLFFADDRQLEPDSLTRALVKRCEELGVQIRENTKVGRFLRKGSTVTGVVTDTGEQIDGDALLLAAGVWSGPLSKELGAPMPIRPGKGYSVDYSPAPIKLNTSLTLEDARVAVTPLDGMIRLAGTMEFGGFEESVNQTRVAAIQRAAAENFDGWDNPPGAAAPWAGLRPMTPDGLPIVGKFGSLDNAYIASGHGMLGLTLAPGTAEIITETIVNHRVPEIATSISPNRFLTRRALRRA
ncbi:FAD-dependent oxidoreductase [Rhodococcus pseudokoreensis]|uniref:FAD-dependent oxidoreductase n=1 Tax=Rhodococcus pseudokoreensis TaxID=2811421 RepID=A0A974ZVN9_9NOCA|nr:FAD-dependent oxidoreductase [Rhodococcus pseudokoreensis]QSE91796.1 FAD-dependent oxidoreductase [Rhodococcus pseudokoreensis]